MQPFVRLRKRLGLSLPVKLKVIQAERPVLVLGGAFAPRGDLGTKELPIVLSAIPNVVPVNQFARPGNFDAFVYELARYTRTRVASEVAKPPQGEFHWETQHRKHTVHNLMTGFRNDAGDNDPEAVGEGVAIQTGLTVRLVKRKVPVVVAEWDRK